MLEVLQLGFGYGEVELFQNLSFTMHESEIRVILGPSGSGKTTLLHLLAGLLALQSGDVRWQGESIRGLSEEVLAQRRLLLTGLIFQHHYLQAELTALENILVPGYLADKVDPDWGLELLNRVGLLDRAHLLPKALSGGERQRIAVARALYNRPKLLLADEPTGSLDRRNAEKVWGLMLSLAQDLGTAVIVATHDEHLVQGLPELRLG
ncbi:MAG: ABC transporter ATP-binding protein [Meiothermus sp.]|uniref:ABC transporter ATP-binding protein n=2 Tax=Meiothermus hypogaeus TaxID=884155 RepID=A0A511QZ87_9DEIN|nr:Lipoprotein-releasing system ATP-binding protein LolD [Meiothermus hypogaeus]GEM82668.1 ABC transporter ATP-binding protein [Meiothermus hypogaeus NBRC 106114]GIW37983.1 MAG: ABC transporter ATP-binding protein [Meiothermus sp.]